MGKFKVEVRARPTSDRIAPGTVSSDLPPPPRIPSGVISSDNCIDAERSGSVPKAEGRDPVARRDASRAPLTRMG
jgi:hypothetical protein